MNTNLTLVLLPGLDGTGRLFSRFIDQAPGRLRTQVVSYPGDREIDYAQLEIDVRAQLPTDGPYAIVGESFSGPVAIALASRPAGDLRGVILAASFATPPAPPIWRYLPLQSVFRLPVPIMVLRKYLAGSDRQLARDIREVARSVSPRVLASRVRATLSVDVRRELATVECPLLYIQATRDLVVPPRCLQDILSVRKDVAVRQVESRHPVLQLEPAASWDIVMEFLQVGQTVPSSTQSEPHEA